MNFKFIYEGLCKKITFSILTIIQFTIGLLCIFISIQTVNQINNSINNVTKYFHSGQYYKIDSTICQTQLLSFDKTTINKDIDTLINISNYLNANPNIELLSVSSDAIFLKRDTALPETIATYSPFKFENIDYVRTYGFYANKNFLSRMNFPLTSGDIKDFKRTKDYIPVILGNIYKDKYKLGDMIDSLDVGFKSGVKKINLKVIGILKDDCYVYQDGISSKKQTLKNAIIYPFDDEILLKENHLDKSEDSIQIGLSNYLSYGYVLLKNNESADKINKDLLNFDLKFQLKDLNKSMSDYKKQILDSLRPAIYTSIIVILFSIISVIIVMLNSIIKDKKEFGINIMFGATMNDIKIRVLGQVLSLFGVSIIISGVILKTFPIFRFNIIDFALTIFIMFIALIIISLAIILRLNKYSINDLIRRND